MTNKIQNVLINTAALISLAGFITLTIYILNNQ